MACALPRRYALRAAGARIHAHYIRRCAGTNVDFLLIDANGNGTQSGSVPILAGCKSFSGPWRVS